MQIGVIGLGRMGGNISVRLSRHGHEVVLYDHDPKVVSQVHERAEKSAPSSGLSDMVSKLAAPRAVWVMLPAGAITEQTIETLSGLLSSGDIIIDGGNSFYKDDIRRAKSLREKGIHYIDVGTSGGVWGLERGYCMMIGGAKEAVEHVDPILSALAPGLGEVERTEGRGSELDARAEQGYLHCGPAGSGHFVKMVHNGIEYGIMEAYAEGFDVMRNKNSGDLPEDERFDLNMADIAEVWRRGSVVSSWLLDLCASALAKNVSLSDFTGQVADSGEGRWTIEAAIEEAVPVPVLTASLFTRFRSRTGNNFAEKMLSAMRFQFGGHVEQHLTEKKHGSEMPEVNSDLTKRLLVPAIYNLAAAGLLDENFSIVAIDWADLGTEALRDQLEQTMRLFVAQRKANAVILQEDVWNWLSQRISYLRGGFDDPDTYERLSGCCGRGNCVFYLAVASRFFGSIVTQLDLAGLTHEAENRYRRVVVEKPFGSDLISARALNVKLLSSLQENQIYRIDHYLGKETVQNILALRFSNGFFEPLWNRQNIDHVQITAAETVGVEKRGRFYENTGALRDMVPNHIMQLLAMVAMEAPTSFDADAVRDEKSKVMAAIHPPDWRAAVRGQYTAGMIAGRPMIGYREEPDVAPESTAETFAALKLNIDNWRWAGVPFYLRTGKRLTQRKTEIAVHFKQAPYALFRDTPVEKLTPNIMVLQIQPSEGVTMQFSAKMPGPLVKLGGVRMKFDYADWFQEGPSTGYETLIYDCLIGDATLFQRADNVEAGWNVVQPVLESWEAGQGELCFYAAGKAGPDEAEALLTRDGRHWLRLTA